MAYYNGHSWQVFNTENSPLPSNTITSLTTDNDKNLWIGSGEGIAVYNPGGVVLDIDSREQPAKKIYSILPNYPNPFNSSTIIQYHLPKSTYVKLTIYNLIGQEIEILINRYQMSGIHQISWAADDLPSGIYFYRLQMDDFSETKKLVLQK